MKAASPKIKSKAPSGGCGREKLKGGVGVGVRLQRLRGKKKSGRASDAAEPSEKSQDKRLPLLFEMQPVAYLHHESLLG